MGEAPSHRTGKGLTRHRWPLGRTSSSVNNCLHLPFTATRARRGDRGREVERERGNEGEEQKERGEEGE